MKSEFLTVPLDEELQQAASSFDCGSSSVFNAFIRDRESLDLWQGKTFVFPYGDRQGIVGYYNIGVGDVLRYDSRQVVKCGGAIHINYLALDKRFRGRFVDGENASVPFRWSDLLLRDCINRIEMIRQQHVGFSFITLSSSAEGRSLYERHGFMRLNDDDMFFINNDSEKSNLGIPMYLPLDFE